ncbi:MAG TPA: trehalose-phosphatase [Salegentibacter sp.]|nr:trehalose-phosphatase [Salegentibacter sp.]
MHKKKTAEELPNLLEHIDEFYKKLGNKKLSLFLDYDGTLTPIVNNPDEAKLLEKNKNIISELSKLIPIAILSGRDRKDLKSKVGIESVIYAGSHGFDITGPNGLEMEHESKADILPALDQAEEELNEKLKNIDGVTVERKKYAIAVHYRNVNEDHIDLVKNTVDEVLDQQDSLKKGGGKKIVELKPAINWHKGRALEWLTKHLDLDKQENYQVFVGDDLTDEDGFEAIQEDGLGIIVGAHSEKTAASYKLQDTKQVTEFLEQLKKGLE